MSRSWQDLLRHAQQALANAREVLVSPAQVRPMPGQPRQHFDAKSIDRLATSLKTIGQVYPGIVRPVSAKPPVRYELLDGERRWRAAKKAGIEYRALLVKVDDAAAAFLVAATANFNRESHTPLEVSDAIAQMLATGMPMKEIAEVLGIHEIWAYEMHGLRKLAPDVRALLDPTLPRSKRLPVTAAVEISRVAPSLQPGLARRVLRRELPLAGLRQEAIAASERAGEAIRTRTLKPSDRWRVIAERARGLCLSIVAMRTRAMAKGGVEELVASRTAFEVRAAVDSLRTAAGGASALADEIDGVFKARRAS